MVISFGLKEKTRVAVLRIPCAIATRAEGCVQGRALADAAGPEATGHVGQSLGDVGAATDFNRCIRVGERGFEKINVAHRGL